MAGLPTSIVCSHVPARPRARGISAFLVDADTPGLDASTRIDVMAPHPLATLRFTGCRVPALRRLGPAGQAGNDDPRYISRFRCRGRLGFARRALAEALARSTGRRMFGQT